MIGRGLSVALVTVCLSVNTAGQGWMVEGGAGLAVARMDDLKYYLDEILNIYPEGIEGKVVSSFPPFMTSSLRIGKEIMPSIWLGAGYTFTSTGGRANYTDYSGSISTDLRAGSHRVGARLAYSILRGESTDLAVYGGAGLNYTRLEETTSVIVLGYSDAVSDTYRSTTICGTAGIQFYYMFNSVSLGLDAGYLVDRPGELSSIDDGDALTDPNDRQRTLTSDWTGLRIQLKAAINL